MEKKLVNKLLYFYIIVKVFTINLKIFNYIWFIIILTILNSKNFYTDVIKNKNFNYKLVTFNKGDGDSFVNYYKRLIIKCKNYYCL